MTIVVYRDGVLAADRWLTDQWGMVSGETQKIWRREDGALCSGAGKAGDLAAFAAWFLEKCVGRWEAKDKQNGFAGITVTAKGEVTLYDTEGHGYQVTAPFHARGAGAELAVGAMAAGADAVRAVEIACQYSSHCGGGVQVAKIGCVTFAGVPVNPNAVTLSEFSP